MPLAAALLFALLAAVQQVLVVCRGAHCAGRIEFAHPGETCCHCDDVPATAHADAEHGADHGADHGNDHLRGGHGGCNDVRLAQDQGPLPRRLNWNERDSMARTFEPAAERRGGVDADVLTDGSAHPATGPPRPQARTALRSTTVLLV